MPGSAGYALDFDGLNDYVTLRRTSATLGGSGWISAKTLSVWIKPEGSFSPLTAPGTGALVAGNDRPRTFGITRATYNGLDRIWVWNFDANGLDSIAVEYTAGEWLQVTLVHDGVTLSAYKNGVLVGSVASGATQLPNASSDGTLYLGGSGRSDPNNYFAGEIDEARFWNIVLTPAEIQAWAYQEVTPAHPNWANLMAYYRMSNGAGALLTDDSDYENSGALNGGMGDLNWVLSGAFQ